MKKFVCFVVFCLFIFCAFAATTEVFVIRIRSQVNTISLNTASMTATQNSTTLYKLYGSLSDSASAFSTSITELETPDISKEDILVYFRIYQSVKVKTRESIDLTITATALKNTNAAYIQAENRSAVVKTTDPVLLNIEGQDTGYFSVTSTKTNENEVTLTLNYIDSSYTVNERNVAYFQGLWKHENGLEEGLYKSEIIVDYKVQ